ncbi:MAG: hypothetical protein RLZZ148_172, partial [Cyanobacteriota bacterium]
MAKKFLLKLKMIVSINFLANLPLGVMIKDVSSIW